jgi:hypothetical protein
MSTNLRHRTSFDYLVRSLLETQRHIEARGLGRLHVDDQLELDWGRHGKLARLRALEDAIGIGRRLPIIIVEVEAILRKPSFADCLIKADRAQYEGQNSHERPT